jgi:hypothetical protein
VHIEQASSSITDDGIMTLAAFLLAAGIWIHKHEFGGASPILPDEDLKPLGLADWHLKDAEPSTRFDPFSGEFREFGDELRYLVDPQRFHSDLGKLVYTAYRSRLSIDLARAVMKGTGSPDPLVRICALTSAYSIFAFSDVERVRRLTEFDFSESETTRTLKSMLLAQVLHMGLSAVNAPPTIAAVQQPSPGLMLIHGTNFPPNRPTWSVPQAGPLFNHIASFRPNVYAKPDYFRWEGGYSDYAREVAAANLDDWVSRRNLGGIDAVTHSHGGNVLMAATKLGIKFNRVVFLSCPVRWHQYSPQTGSIQKPQSVRLRLDFVIMADHSAQRFPTGSGISEKILPIWFVSHSSTTLPATWLSENLDRYIR